MKNRNYLKLTIFGLIALVLTGCSTYPNKFKCGDAKGLGCTMLRDVDRQIKSGQIEEAYREKGKCHGNKCSTAKAILEDEVPILAPANRAKINNLEKATINQQIIDDESSLYF